MFKLLKILIISAFMLTPFAALAKGDPVFYIKLIVKQDPEDMMVKDNTFTSDKIKGVADADLKGLAEQMVNLSVKELKGNNLDTAFVRRIKSMISPKQFEAIKAGKSIKIVHTVSQTKPKGKITLIYEFSFK